MSSVHMTHGLVNDLLKELGFHVQLYCAALHPGDGEQVLNQGNQPHGIIVDITVDAPLV